MRTQEEIIKRFNESDDFIGIQKGDLIDLLTFENAKQFLKKEYVESIEKCKEEWKQKIETKTIIMEYLPFAYGKAEDERGLSAARSILHFKTWIWFDDEKFYNEIISDMENYTDYGIEVLNKIAAHYGYSRT